MSGRPIKRTLRDRYVQEFAGRQNLREQDTIEQLAALSEGMDGKRLRYRTLIASNGLAW